jgi:outer membrane autotransporter protein
MFVAYTSGIQKNTNLSRFGQALRGSTALCALMVAVSFAGEAKAQTVTSGTISDAQSGNVNVGADGNIRILSGGTLTNATNASNYIGTTGANATMNIDAGGVWNTITGSSSPVRIGNDGSTGVLTVNGTLVTGGTLAVGGAIGTHGGNGTLNIDGGTVTNAAAALRVGFVGATGTVNITNGGTLETSLTGTALNIIGDATGAVKTGTGIVNISGTGSSWTIGSMGLFVVGTGAGAQGTLAISDGGRFSYESSRPDVPLIGQLGGTGIVTVDGAGSLFENTSGTGLTLGNGAGATGTMTLSNGGTANITGPNTVIVGYQTGTGTLNVSSGGTLNSEEDIYIGNDGGSGTLNVTNGGKINVTAGTIDIGAGGNATGLVDGQGSVITTMSGMAVGNQGATGSLTVSNGGVVTSANGWALIGGNAGTGTLDVTSGGKVLMGDAVSIGWGQGTGTANVIGAGSRIEATNQIEIGLDTGTGAATGTLTVAEGGTIKASRIAVGFGPAGHGTLNIGTGGAAGIVDGTIQMSGASSTINFNHNEANYTFSSAITDFFSGSPPTDGSVNFIGTGTTTLTAVNTYMSATNVNAGKLVIAEGASIANSSLTTVNTGGTLAGAGSVGDVDVKSGGTIAPTALKTLTVKDITFADGSTYQVVVNAAGENSKIAADSAALNGAVKVMAGSGNYALGTTYTILTTTGSVSGTFDSSVVSDFAFLTVGLDYDTNKVDLSLTRNNASFESVAHTANQNAVGRGLDVADVTSPVFGAVVQQNAAGARQALDALSGEAHASNKVALISNALLIGDTVGRRVSDPRDNGAAPVRSWAQGFGNWMDRGSDGNAAKLESTTGGIISGIDATVSNWRFGVAAGYSQTDTDVNARSSSLETDSYHLSVYGGTRQGPYGLLLGSVYSWSDVSSDRTVAFPGFSEALHGSYDASTVQVFGEANVRFPAGRAIIEPFAGFSYINHHTDAFNETGGAAALHVTVDDHDTTFTTVGVRPSIALGQGLGYTITGRGTVAWRHAFGDVDTGLITTLAGSLPFKVAGTPIAEDEVLLEAGIDVNVSPNALVGLSWSGQFGEEATDNQLKGQLLYRW